MVGLSVIIFLYEKKVALLCLIGARVLILLKLTNPSLTLDIPFCTAVGDGLARVGLVDLEHVPWLGQDTAQLAHNVRLLGLWV